MSLAHVIHEQDQTPRLLLCESRPVDNSTTSAAVLSELSQQQKLLSVTMTALLQLNERHLLLLEAPQVEDHELAQAVRWKIKDLINFSVEDAVIDVIKIPQAKQLHRTPMVYVVVAQKDHVQRHITTIEHAKLELEVIDVPDMAQRNIAALLADDHNGVALLSLQGKGGLLTISRQGYLYLSRELDIGMDQLKAEIQQQASAEVDTNEAIFLHAASTTSSPFIQSLERIVLEVQRSLDYYESHYGQPQINSLLLAPVAEHMLEIQEYFTRQLGIKIHQLDLNTLFDSEQQLSTLTQANCFFAVGAALRNAGE